MLKNMKKVIISLMVIALVIGTANVVFATDNQKSAFDGLDLPQEGTTNIKEGEGTEDIPEGTNNTDNNNNNNITNNNNNTTENLPEKTPYTGIGDYSGIIFVVIFGISAIYAYKKVKEYNA